jgi:hypothetical protein
MGSEYNTQIGDSGASAKSACLLPDTVVLANECTGVGHPTSQGSSVVASGREDGTIVLWRKDQSAPISTLSGPYFSLPSSFHFINSAKICIFHTRSHWKHK